jgi:replicative DNA helicase
MSGIDVKNKNRNDIVGEISRGLKQLAKELEVPVIGLAQLSRAVESRSDKIPQLSDLRESGSIEQDADSVLFLMRPEQYGLMNEYNIEGSEYSSRNLCLGIIGKNRHGETKNIAMKWNGATMTVSTHQEGLQTYVAAAPQKNISIPYNNQIPRNVSGDDGWPTMDEKDLI